MSTAAIIIIGNELLHGEIEDENGPWLIEQLNDLGVDVRRLHLLPDEIDVLVRYLKRSNDQYDYVLTAGGIGPTHDDLTRTAVARATDRPLVTDEQLLELLWENHGQELEPSQKRLANLPEDSEIAYLQDTVGITFRVENIYVFPGIPELLRPLFFCWETEFTGEKKYTESITITALESDIADELSDLQDRYPNLQFGSYPSQDASLTVKVRGRDEDKVRNAYKKLQEVFFY